jgi:hypothetical protein
MLNEEECTILVLAQLHGRYQQVLTEWRDAEGHLRPGNTYRVWFAAGDRMPLDCQVEDGYPEFSRGEWLFANSLQEVVWWLKDTGFSRRAISNDQLYNL